MTGNDVNAMLTDLNDPDMETWTQAERITWMNAGMREIATLKPKATTVTASIALVAGVTRQPVPADTIQVLDLTVNMGADGATPGRTITTTTADRLKAASINWRADKGAAVRHLVVDDRDPKAFYVWPAIKTGPWYVEALQHKFPTPIAALGDTLALDDSYLNALSEYVMHMAYARDSEIQAHGELSVAHYTKFAQILGVQIQKQKKASAPANSAENPAFPAVDKNGA